MYKLLLLVFLALSCMTPDSRKEAAELTAPGQILYRSHPDPGGLGPTETMLVLSRDYSDVVLLRVDDLGNVQVIGRVSIDSICQ